MSNRQGDEYLRWYFDSLTWTKTIFLGITCLESGNGLINCLHVRAALQVCNFRAGFTGIETLAGDRLSEAVCPTPYIDAFQIAPQMVDEDMGVRNVRFRIHSASIVRVTKLNCGPLGRTYMMYLCGDGGSTLFLTNKETCSCFGFLALLC